MDGASEESSGREYARSASDRAWRDAPDGAAEWLIDGLSNSRLRSVLLEVGRRRAERIRPADALAAWRTDRFVRPAATDPRELARVEASLWAALPADTVGIDLSPVAPLGSSSAVTGLSQNRVVSTMRLGEVVSDSTNVLALEAAARRTRARALDDIHLASSHRQLRAQDFGPDAVAHFRLFALVSSARDAGSGRTEASLLLRHLTYWAHALHAMVPNRSPRMEVTVWDTGSIAERLRDTVLPALAGAAVPVVEVPERTRGRGYYEGVALRLSADDGAVELGDGGLTTWTAQLMANRKERCLVSCVSVERLAELSSDE